MLNTKINNYELTESVRNILNAKCELALMGRVVRVSGMNEFKYCTEYIAKAVLGENVVSGEHIMQKATRYIDTSETKPIGLVVNTLMGELVTIAIIMEDTDSPVPLDDEDGVLCYCYTLNAPDCSELGYCFFKKVGENGYKRIG